MSWNTIYPVLTNEALDEYEARATPAERARMEDGLASRQS